MSSSIHSVAGVLRDGCGLCRDVEMLANVLGPLIAPLAGRAGDVASAAYLARTLSRLPPSLASLPADHSPDQSRADAEGMSGGGCSTDSMRRAATDTWILSIGWVPLSSPLWHSPCS